MSRSNQINEFNRKLLRAQFSAELLLTLMGGDDWSDIPFSTSAKLVNQHGSVTALESPLSWLELLIKIDDQLIRAGLKFKTNVVDIFEKGGSIHFTIGERAPRYMDISPPSAASKAF